VKVLKCHLHAITLHQPRALEIITTLLVNYRRAKAVVASWSHKCLFIMLITLNIGILIQISGNKRFIFFANPLIPDIHDRV